MRVWKVKIEDSPEFNIAAETSNEAAAAAKILYAAIAASPEDARKKFYQDGHTVEVFEVCKLDSISLPQNFPRQEIDLEAIINRASQMLEQLQTAVKAGKLFNG